MIWMAVLTADAMSGKLQIAADHQPRQVIACAGLLCAGAGADDFAAGGDHLQRQHVLAHRAVADRIGAAGPGRGHAAYRCVGAGIDRKKQPGVADLIVELVAGDAGLDRDGQVFAVDAQHLVHPCHVDADAALDREQMAFQRRAGAERDHRHLVLVGQRHRGGHFFGAFGKHHGVWRRHLERRFVAAMLFAHRLGGRATLAETRFQRSDHLSGDGPTLGHQQVGGQGGVHRLDLRYEGIRQ
jgi:hypothetical protein